MNLKYLTYRLISLIVLLMLFPMSSISTKANSATIWLLTDIHHFSPSLFDEGSKLQEMQNQSAGVDLRYSSQRLASLLQQIEQESPSVLLVAGDLTLNGEYQSMTEISLFFQAVEALGTDVFVIPGNHDISNAFASSYIGDQIIRTQQVLANDFEQLFADFGYDEAISRDKDSLSYVINLNDDWRLFMLDSNIYSKGVAMYAPQTNGNLSNSTLNWLRKQLIDLETSHQKALVVIHHNSLIHFSALHQQFTLDNADDLQELLAEFNVPLTLSGHLHAQHITTEQITESANLTDIVTGAFAVYPNPFAEITVDKQQFQYDFRTLDMDSWLADQDNLNKDLVAYHQYMLDLFSATSNQVALDNIIVGHAYSETQKQNTLDMFREVNLATFTGNMQAEYTGIIERYGELIEELAEYQNDFFISNVLEMLDMHTENHRQLDIIW